MQPADVDSALNLRPLTVGEVFDRSVNLYFKNFLLLTSLLAIVILPLLLLQYLGTKDWVGAYFALIVNAMQHPSSSPPLGLETLTDAIARDQVWSLLAQLVAVVGIPLSQTAVVVAVSRAYLGLKTTFAECYRMAFKRIGWVVLVWLMWLTAFFVIFFAAFVVMAFVIAALAGAAAMLHGDVRIAVIVLAAVLSIVFAIAAIGLAIALYIAFSFSVVSAIVEGADPIRAISSAFSRTFGGGQFWRSMTVSLAIFAVTFGGSMFIALFGAAAAYFLKSAEVYILASALGNVFLGAFAYVVVAVYYYDVRVRREGLDLQLLSTRLGQAAPTAAAT